MGNIQALVHSVPLSRHPGGKPFFARGVSRLRHSCERFKTHTSACLVKLRDRSEALGNLNLQTVFCSRLCRCLC
jgi:hypothetical protein